MFWSNINKVLQQISSLMNKLCQKVDTLLDIEYHHSIVQDKF